MTRIRNIIINLFIGGVIVALPVIILFHIVLWLFNLFHETTLPLTEFLNQHTGLSQTTAFLVTMIGLFILFSLIGMFVRTRLGGNIYRFIEKISLDKIPGYRTIKDRVEQISGKQKGLFRKVVVVRLGDIAATGFIVDELDDNHSTVFVPCGPNPTTGFILHVANEAITETESSVEDAMKTVIACGAGSARIVSNINRTDPQVFQ